MRVADPSPGAGSGAEVVLVLKSSPGLGTLVQPPLGAPQSRSSTRSSKSTNPPVVEPVLVSPRGRARTNALAALVAELDTVGCTTGTCLPWPTHSVRY